MKKLWKCIRTHKKAAGLFLVYWLATLAVAVLTWNKGIPTPVVGLLFAPSLIAGALMGRWREATPERMTCPGGRLRGGMLAGALCGGITILVMPGGVGAAAIEWIQNGRMDDWDDALGFFIIFMLVGAVLGLVGAAIANPKPLSRPRP